MYTITQLVQLLIEVTVNLIYKGHISRPIFGQLKTDCSIFGNNQSQVFQSYNEDKDIAPKSPRMRSTFV